MSLDAATVSGWVVALAALATLFVMMKYRGQDVGETKLAERLKPINEKLDRHDGHHAKHFYTTGAAQTLTASIKQELSDHQRQDDERFKRIEEMHGEIRSDIKELLKRSDGR